MEEDLLDCGESNTDLSPAFIRTYEELLESWHCTKAFTASIRDEEMGGPLVGEGTTGGLPLGDKTIDVKTHPYSPDFDFKLHR